MSKKYPLLDDKDWIYQKYWVEKISSQQIAENIGCSRGAIRKAFKRHNIKMRSVLESLREKRHYGFLYDEQWLYQKYWIEELSGHQIAEIVGCTENMVHIALRRYNIPHRNRSEAKKGRHLKHPELSNRQWLYQKYWIEDLSLPKIADIIGCSIENVCKSFKRLDIKRRTVSEAISGKRNPNFGREFSKRHRDNISKTRKELYKNPRFAKMMFYAIAKRPTNPEKAYQEIVDNNSLPFKYTGDGKVVIEGRCPDFTHLTKKIVVEIFGYAYHAPLFAFFNVKYQRTYEGTIKHYKKHGYKCVIFWDRDLLREDAEQFVLAVLHKEGIIM